MSARPKSREPNTYSIGEVAREIGVSARTIRYYEEIGLIDSVSRVQGGRRIFRNEEVRRLKFIRKLKHLGLALSEMVELAELYRDHKGSDVMLPRLTGLLDEQLARIDNRIGSLRELKKEILSYRTRAADKAGIDKGTEDVSWRR